jgi:type VI protein secretion system component VasF
MAEIRIEKKKGIPLWAILLLLIVLLALAWMFLSGRDDATPNADTRTSSVERTAPASTEWVEWLAAA